MIGGRKMPGIVQNELGKITIDDEIIASIAGYATIENYGIVGMASKSATEGLWELLKRENVKKGVKVSVGEKGVRVDLYVMVEYGVSINAVANNVIDNVTYRIHDLTGLEIDAVNVHVEGVRI
jgi:uncharacterized alkaline shock family protein YloU